ncbi:MAG: hypothetical protein JO152_08475, partial [Mycobacteriaceae bacterium]|nr:hypothetical protein [Mycobacteriaceae bacterium]
MTSADNMALRYEGWEVSTATDDVAAPPQAPVPRRLSWQRLGFAALLVATAALYLWGLSASGWANSFYSAAAQA